MVFRVPGKIRSSIRANCRLACFLHWPRYLRRSCACNLRHFGAGIPGRPDSRTEYSCRLGCRGYYTNRPVQTLSFCYLRNSVTNSLACTGPIRNPIRSPPSKPHERGLMCSYGCDFWSCAPVSPTMLESTFLSRSTYHGVVSQTRRLSRCPQRRSTVGINHGHLSRTFLTTAS